jgi:pyruvate/2-oxoglutarate dehydrogenase complex dihydrolipoamide dehydrogenase (E3) component
MAAETTVLEGESKKPLEIVIVGGGVCGLICAIALAKRGINAQVYEAAVRHVMLKPNLDRLLTLQYRRSLARSVQDWGSVSQNCVFNDMTINMSMT